MSSLPGLLVIVLGLYLMHLGFNGASWLPISSPENVTQNPYLGGAGGGSPRAQ